MEPEFDPGNEMPNITVIFAGILIIMLTIFIGALITMPNNNFNTKKDARCNTTNKNDRSSSSHSEPGSP